MSALCKQPKARQWHRNRDVLAFFGRCVFCHLLAHFPLPLACFFGAICTHSCCCHSLAQLPLPFARITHLLAHCVCVCMCVFSGIRTRLTRPLGYKSRGPPVACGLEACYGTLPRERRRTTFDVRRKVSALCSPCPMCVCVCVCICCRSVCMCVCVCIYMCCFVITHLSGQ